MSLLKSEDMIITNKTIRSLIREFLVVNKSVHFLREDSDKFITYDERAKIKVLLSPMTQKGVVYFSKKFSSKVNDSPVFIVKITHDFLLVEATGKLSVNKVVIDDFTLADSLTPTYVESLLSLQEVKNSTLTLSGFANKSTDSVDLNASFNLTDYISFDVVDSNKPGYIVEITIGSTQRLLASKGRELENIKLPDGSYPVPSFLVLDNPGRFGLFLGNPTSSRYSKEPYDRYCGPKEEDPNCEPLRPHFGMDLTRIAGNSIGAPIVAPLDGFVEQKPDKGGASGNVIVMKHDDGSHTKYLHLQSYEGAGGRVEAGQVIGYLGDTGRAKGAHLHFETYPPGADPEDGTSSINPADWLRDNDAWFPISSNVSKIK